MKTSNASNLILLTLFGLAGSALIGYVLYGTQIFDHRLSKFQFIDYGFAGSIFIGLLKYRPQKDQIFAFALIFLLHLTIFIFCNLNRTK